MVWRRHDWSSPKVISRLTRSYRGGDGVEHGADAGRLLLALGKRLGRHAQLK